MGKLLNAYSDLDLDPTKLSIELIPAIFIYYNVFRIRVPRSISFELLCGHTHTNTHTHTHTHTHTRTHTHTHRDIQGLRGGALGGCVFFIRGES